MKFWALFTMFWTCFVKPGRFQDRVIFPTSSENEVQNSSMTIEGIPESLLLMMKDVNNASEFMRRFVINEPSDDFDDDGDDMPSYFSAKSPSASADGLSEIPGRVEDNIKSIVHARKAFAAAGMQLAQFAACRPELQVVKMKKAHGATSGVMMWPPCVRVKRCGGCCTSKLLECSPTEVSIINVTVLQVRISPQRPDAFESDGPKIVSLEQHEKCACGCRERPEDCIPGVQEYRPSECRCACINQYQALQCTGPEKFWDSAECACKCRHPTECSTGYYYSLRDCRCQVFRNTLIGILPPRAESQDTTLLQPTTI